MGHGHHHHHHAPSGSDKNILIAFGLNAGFAVLEFIGGYFTNSVAVYSDALHDLGDSIALLFAYLSEKLSLKDADEKFTYGYRRFSVLSALVNGIILLVGSGYVIYEAIMRLQAPEPVDPKGMFLLGILGIVVNGIAAWRLSKGSGVNQRMVMFHLLEDLLGWVAVIIVSCVLFFKPWYMLDSILSILISLIILRGVYENLKKVAGILAQRFPDDLDMGELKGDILKIEGVKDVHAVRGWAIDDLHFSLSFHVVVSQDCVITEMDQMKVKIKALLEEEHVRFSSIEFEGEKNRC